MIIPEPKTFRHSDENMLPMINIVFLLLVFFMVAGAITAADYFDLTPVTSEQGSSTPQPEQIVELSADGQWAFAGKAVSAQQLVTALQARPSNQKPLPIKADAAATSADLLLLMQALKNAGIEQVRLLATGE